MESWIRVLRRTWPSGSSASTSRCCWRWRPRAADAASRSWVGNVGVTLEVAARSIGARRVMELGSGFGYSAYWFARAVGPDGEVRCTDGDPANAEAGASFLRSRRPRDTRDVSRGRRRRAALAARRPVRTSSSATSTRRATPTPASGSERIRLGGLYLCDNTLGYGSGTVFDDGDGPEAIREHNRLIAEDEALHLHDRADPRRCARCDPGLLSPHGTLRSRLRRARWTARPRRLDRDAIAW
jgi:hypothetical protein